MNVLHRLLVVAQHNYFVLFVILLLAFGARLYKVTNPVADWHSWRQADTASVTRIYLERGIDLLHPRYHDISYLQSGKFNPQGFRFVEFPIYNALHAVLVKSFPFLSLEVWGRVLSIVASLFSTVFVFILGRRFLGERGGLISAFFFAFLPFNIYFSRVILPEPMAVAFALLSLVLFVKWFDLDSRFFLFSSGFFFSLAMLVKPYVIFYAIPMVWLTLKKFNFEFGRVFKNRELWGFAAIVLTPVVLWRVWMIRFPEGIPFYKWVFNSDGIRFRPSFWRWIFGERVGRLILGGWGIFVFVGGLATKGKSRECGFVLAFILSSFVYVAIVASANVRHDYYQTLIIPAVSLVLARGVIYLWEIREGFYQPLLRLFILICGAWGLLFSWYEIRELYKVNHPEIIRAGEALDKIAPKDALVVAPYNGDTAFLYHTKRSGWPYQTNSIEELVSNGANYYVSVNLNDPQTQDVMRKYEIPLQTEEYVIVDLGKKRLPQE